MAPVSKRWFCAIVLAATGPDLKLTGHVVNTPEKTHSQHAEMTRTSEAAGSEFAVEI